MSKTEKNAHEATRQFLAERDQIRETFAAMRARNPRMGLNSARDEFDEWLTREWEAARGQRPIPSGRGSGS